MRLFPRIKQDLPAIVNGKISRIRNHSQQPQPGRRIPAGQMPARSRRPPFLEILFARYGYLDTGETTRKNQEESRCFL